MTDIKQKHIIHLDMDAFYASVEVLDNPELKGLPVIIGGISDRGVVSTASYEARVFGVHSAQPVIKARKLCPHGIFLPGRMHRYKAVSERIFEIFRRYTPLVEPLSLDEAFLDVTGSIRLFGPPVEIAREIKRLVKEEIGLTVSAGVAPSKFVAKIASDIDKPDGLTVIEPDEVCPFLHKLPIGRLWGVGRVSRKALGVLGVETIGDLAGISPDVLEKKFGALGRHISLLSRGIDGREVDPEREVKSIGAEDTFPEDIVRIDEAKRELLRLAVRVSRRLRKNGFFSKTITLKVKYSDFQLITRSETLSGQTDQVKVIYETVCGLLSLTDVGKRPVRLLGISLSKLCLDMEPVQSGLFERAVDREKSRKVDQAVDMISEKFGDKSILPATLLEEGNE